MVFLGERSGILDKSPGVIVLLFKALGSELFVELLLNFERLYLFLLDVSLLLLLLTPDHDVGNLLDRLGAFLDGDSDLVEEI